MADYKINILAEVTGLDKAEQQIRNILKLNGETVRINVETGKLDQQIQQIQKGMTVSGKIGGTNFSKGFIGSVKAIKAPTLKEVVNLNKRIKSDTEKALKDIKIFDPGIDQNVAKKSASQYVNQKVKAEQKAQAEVEKARQASLKQIEKIEESSAKRQAQQRIAEMKSNVALKNAPTERQTQIMDTLKNWPQRYKELASIQSQADKILQNYQSKSFELQDAKMRSQIDKYADLNQDSLNRYTDSYKAINKNAASYYSDRNIKNAKNLVKANDDYGNSVKKLGNEFKIASANGDELVSAKKVSDLRRSLSSFWDSNTKMHGTSYGKQLENIFSELDAGRITNSKWKEIQDSVSSIKEGIQLDGLGGKGLLTSLGSGLKQLGQLASTFNVAQMGIESINDMARNVLDVNSAMIELRKVSTASDQDISDYYDEAAQSALKYGASIDEVINSTADWSRLGYGLEEAKELSNATTLLQRVGDNMTQETSSQGLISTLKGFSLASEQATEIVDAAN